MSDPDDAASELATLATGLDIGAGLYRRGDAAGQRLGVLYQLSAVLRLLEELRFSAPDQERLAPLRHLAYALADLDRGARDPLLAPPPSKPGRMRNPTKETGLRARAAVAMELLMRSGKSKDDAASEVARRKRSLKAAAIAKWREHAMRERPAEDLTTLRYQEMLTVLAGLFPNDPAAAAAHLLSRMAKSQ